MTKEQVYRDALEQIRSQLSKLSSSVFKEPNGEFDKACWKAWGIADNVLRGYPAVEPDWTDANGKRHRYKCGLNPDPTAIKHMVAHCTCPAAEPTAPQCKCDTLPNEGPVIGGHVSACPVAFAIASRQAEPPAEASPSAHLMTVSHDVDRWVARCSCNSWKTEVIVFWPHAQFLGYELMADFRTWHGRHLQHLNRPAPHE